MTTTISDLPAWYVRVTDLKQYEYCRRVVYYEYCLPGLRPTTYKMMAGMAEQERVNELEERRSLAAYEVAQGERHFHVSITSPTLGYTGQIDMVIDTVEAGKRTLIPVDFKLSRHGAGAHFKLQLAAYALLLEEGWGAPVQRGALYLIPTKEVLTVPITTRLRNTARQHLVEIRQMVEAQQMPAPTPQRGRCVNCEFRRFCNDVL
jgi:CRISPR-associated exonuclease Cas4